MLKASLLSLLFVASSYGGETCFIETHSRVLKINKTLDASCIKNTNCDPKVARGFIKFLSGASGKLKARHLERMFKAEYNVSIDFKNDLEVQELKDFICEELDLKDAVLTRLTSLYGQASLNLSGQEQISAHCSTCEEPGEKNLKLIIDEKTIWFSAELKTKRMGYKLVRDVSPFAADGLTREMIQESAALDDGKSGIFTDIDKIHFYRPNRPLSKGKTLRLADLLPRSLVKVNQPVELLLKGENISLKTKAMPRQSGKYGQTIRVYNPKTKKSLQAKVIDFNTVMVEL